MFAISGRNLPDVRSYEDALKTWDEAHQHARFGTGWRGLKDKRDTNKIIRKEGDKIFFRYHTTDLVTWLPDRIWIKQYDSPSSCIFTNCFTPPSVWAVQKKGEMYVACNGGYYQSSLLAVEIVKDKFGWAVTPESVYQFPKYTLDKSKAAKIRKVLKPFRDYRDSVLRLRGGRHEAEYCDEYRLCVILRNLFASPQMTEEMQRDLLSEANAYDDSLLLKNAYLTGGAVSVTHVAGELRPENPYAGRSGLHYI
jgi:hypothetical protein